MPERKATDAFRKATTIGPDREAEALSTAAAAPLTHGDMPLSPDMLRSLGKPLSELLGTLFKTPTKSGLPAKLRLTNWDAKSGEASMHGLTKVGQEFRSTPSQLDSLINSDTVDLAQPPVGAVDAIRRKLAALLGP